eukprot:325079-Karenia_brevis.AAC.1
MSDMLQAAGMEDVHQPQPGLFGRRGPQQEPRGPEAGLHRAKIDWSIRLTDQEWQDGPGALMSIGDMLRAV